MTTVVAILGGMIVVLGLTGLASPVRLRAFFSTMSSQSRFVAAILLRLGMGALLWFAAHELRFPGVIRVIAVIAFLAAIGIVLMGRDRLDKLVNWWLARPDKLFRVSMVFAGAFGGFLVYAAV